MSRLTTVILIIVVVLTFGCVETSQHYSDIGVSFDVVNVTRIHEHDNTKYSIYYISPDCNCAKEMTSGRAKAKGGTTVFINIIERNSTISRLTIDEVQGNSNIISSKIILEITNRTIISDVYR